jgi:septum formation topological specificity factor MinE
MAAISALHFIPPNIDLANDIMDRIARYIEPRLEDVEAEIQAKTDQVWSDDMTHYLMERELGAAYRSADRWADRMQAAIAEDQQAFEQQRRKIQKLRNTARK